MEESEGIAFTWGSLNRYTTDNTLEQFRGYAF